MISKYAKQLEKVIDHIESERDKLLKQVNGYAINISGLQAIVEQNKIDFDNLMKINNENIDRIDRLKAEVENEKKESVYWRNTEAKILAADCVKYREDRDLWESRAKKLAEALRNLVGQYGFDSAKPPEWHEAKAALAEWKEGK